MEIAKEDYFDVKYNSYKDVLESNTKKKESILRKHKFIAVILGITLICVSLNLYLIYKFFAILFSIGA